MEGEGAALPRLLNMSSLCYSPDAFCLLIAMPLVLTLRFSPGGAQPGDLLDKPIVRSPQSPRPEKRSLQPGMLRILKA